MKPSLTHVAMHVPDVPACVDFYRSYCGLVVTHERASSSGGQVVWLGEDSGRAQRLVLVLIPGGTLRPQAPDDFGHLGFAVESRAAVDVLAERARAAGILRFGPLDEPYPVGYYCFVADPAGRMVEFSYGQPLGPGAPDHSS